MSIFSRRGSKGHYPQENNGWGYYKRPHGSGGILGKIFDMLQGSGKHSKPFSDSEEGYRPYRHHRKSSWS